MYLIEKNELFMRSPDLIYDKCLFVAKIIDCNWLQPVRLTLTNLFNYTYPFLILFISKYPISYKHALLKYPDFL